MLFAHAGYTELSFCTRSNLRHAHQQAQSIKPLYFLYTGQICLHPRRHRQVRDALVVERATPRESPKVVSPGTRPGFGPPASKRTLVPAPKAHADPNRIRMLQGPCSVTLRPSIWIQGPCKAGGQAPPIHRVTKSRQGTFHIYIYIYI